MGNDLKYLFFGSVVALSLYFFSKPSLENPDIVELTSPVISLNLKTQPEPKFEVGLVGLNESEKLVDDMKRLSDNLTSSNESSLDDVVQNIGSLIMEERTTFNNGKIAAGSDIYSGNFILLPFNESNHAFVSAYHLFEPNYTHNKTFKFTISDSKKETYYASPEAIVFADNLDDNLDLVIGLIPNSGINVNDVSIGHAKKNDLVYVIPSEAAKHDGWDVLPGKIMGEDNLYIYLYAGGKVRDGYSGSPVFKEDGSLVGIIVSVERNSSTNEVLYTHAIKSEQILKLIDFYVNQAIK